MKFPALFLLAAPLLFAQTDWERWETKKADFTIESPYQSTYLYDNSSTEMEILSAVRNGYAFFISDLDGDNCPFFPSCSRFFLLSVKRTIFFQGILMFADRFTRDSNFIKNLNHYRIHKSGKIFDPVNLYTLDAYQTKKTYIEYRSFN